MPTVSHGGDLRHQDVVLRHPPSDDTGFVLHSAGPTETEVWMTPTSTPRNIGCVMKVSGTSAICRDE